MKVVILAGGLGTRISEESHLKPKPMIEVGGMPILWHIMKIYSHHGINDFIVCLGYRGYAIKEYFANYFLHTSDVTFDMVSNSMEVHERHAEPWRVTLVDTGPKTLTGGRLKRVAQHIGNETFCLTYGDGLSNVDISAEIAFHRAHGKLATVAAVQPPGRFGVLNTNTHGNVTSFEEKPSDEIGWINGGFFVLEPAAIDYIEGDATSFESQPLQQLALDGQLAAFEHTGFWQPCDTLRDKRQLEQLWQTPQPPWKVWQD